MAEPLLRLNVWRPARPGRQLAYTGQVANGPSVSVLQEDRLHEQVYSWQINEDLWGSNTGIDMIKETLTTAFLPDLPPEKRGFIEMKSLVEKIEEYMAQESNRNWGDWAQPIKKDDPENLYHMQPLLALCHHLKWLCEVFQDIPGASVTVR